MTNRITDEYFVEWPTCLFVVAAGTCDYSRDPEHFDRVARNGLTVPGDGETRRPLAHFVSTTRHCGELPTAK